MARKKQLFTFSKIHLAPKISSYKLLKMTQLENEEYQYLMDRYF